MNATLVVPPQISERLIALAGLEVETGAVLLVRPVPGNDSRLRLLARGLYLVPDAAYVHRRSDSLLITSDGYVPTLSRAEEEGCIPIWVHTHPGEGSSPEPSSHDRHVDAQLGDVFRLRSGSDYYGALIVSRERGALRFTGHLDNANGDVVRIQRILGIGPRLSLAWNDETPTQSLSSLFDRNIRAFGGDVQRVLHDLTIGVVGCGGTGSAVAEQLVRLGVRNFTLVDPDTLSESNLTRVYGSFPEDVGRRKVDVVADHLQAIAPDSRIRRVASAITAERSARELIHTDVIFGCTDDNAGRLVLSRIATFLLIPVIDCGVLLSSQDGRLDGIHGRITVMYPGAACLACRGRIDLSRASSEMMTPGERIRRADEGYAPALAGVEPAVVAFTTFVAAAAVTELIERITHFGPDPVPSEVILRVHERETSTNVSRPLERHYCHIDSGKIGIGMTVPFLEQTWLE